MISFTSDQVIRCKNEECIVETFRLRIYLDQTENGKPDWGISRIAPSCPSCHRTNYESVEVTA